MNAGFVLDCSVAMSWCFEDEANDLSENALDRLARESAFVPGLWPLEVANVLAISERKKRLTAEKTLRFVSLLRSLPITIDPDTATRAFDAILTLSRERGLTAYDATYLELAIRYALPLATQDASLRRAAKATGVDLL